MEGEKFEGNKEQVGVEDKIIKNEARGRAFIEALESVREIQKTLHHKIKEVVGEKTWPKIDTSNWSKEEKEQVALSLTAFWEWGGGESLYQTANQIEGKDTEQQTELIAEANEKEFAHNLYHAIISAFMDGANLKFPSKEERSEYQRKHRSKNV